MNTLNINIDINFEQLVSVVKQLSPKERMDLNDIIWAEPTDIPIEHQRISLERLADYEKDPKKFLDWDEVCEIL